jgi:acetyl-CoA carboxylase biotin carboxyl carrier protein
MANEDQSPEDIDVFDVNWLRRLVEMMNEHELSEIELRQSRQRIRLRKGGEPVISGFAPPVASFATSPAPASSAAPPALPAAADTSFETIKSPMVGTFYTAPNPESPPFVKVGDHVGPTTTVGVIEAMKVFNEIPADKSGQIVAVLVENGEPVEYNQPLFKIDTRK